MAVSKFAIACVVAVIAGGASAGLADNDSAAPPAQTTATVLGTPVYAIAQPRAVFQNTPVQFTSGKRFAHVVGVAVNDAGKATRLRIALDDMPSQQLWVDEGDLVYSRARDVIIAHDIHTPAMAVASAE